MNVFEKSGKIIKHVTKAIGDKSPVILTGCAVAGVVTTVIFAVKATPKAELILERHRDLIEDASPEEKKKAIISTSLELGKVYGPTIISGVATIGCIIGAQSINSSRQIMLATAYNLSTKEFKEFREKTKEIAGENKYTSIKDAVAEDHAKELYSNDLKPIPTGHGTTICFDDLNGRYFYSSAEYIKKVLMDSYRHALVEEYITYDDIYYDLGLPTAKGSSYFGITSDDAKKLIDFEGGGVFTSMLTEDSEPVLVMNLPIPGYYDKIGPSYLKGWRD